MALRPLFLILLALACAPREAPVDRAADSVAVATRVQERLAAALTGDTARWHRHVDDAAVWTGPALRNATTREVIGSIAANHVVTIPAQRIADLVVHLDRSGSVAQATYVQFTGDTSRSARTGKRFRKTDTYVRRGTEWWLVGGTEVAVPFRPAVVLDSTRSARLVGRYVLPGVDTSEVIALRDGRVVMRWTDGTVDTLLAESDSTVFEEGDPGTWVFPRAGRGLVYRMAGGSDVVLTRIPPVR